MANGQPVRAFLRGKVENPAAVERHLLRAEDVRQHQTPALVELLFLFARE
jgi:hypothetical protein